MKIRCRTNLDLYGEVWPTDLPEAPLVGDTIVSETRWGQEKVSVELVVVGRTWKPIRNSDIVVGFELEIEMHLPAHFKNISIFELWYDKIRGKISQEYYRNEYGKLEAEHFTIANRKGRLQQY